MTEVTVPTAEERKAAKAKLLALNRAREGWSDRHLYAGIACLWGGFSGALAEGMRWLHSGVWQPYRTWPVGRALIEDAWLDAPTSWHGLHRVVTGFLDWPLFVTGPIMAGLAVWLVWILVEDHYETKIKAFGEETPSVRGRLIRGRP